MILRSITLIFNQVALLDNEDMNAVDGDDDWQFVSIGEQQNFGIRTAGLEEKATACQMLVCYARELKDGFADYTEQVSCNYSYCFGLSCNRVECIQRGRVMFRERECFLPTSKVFLSNSEIW